MYSGAEIQAVQILLYSTTIRYSTINTIRRLYRMIHQYSITAQHQSVLLYDTCTSTAVVCTVTININNTTAAVRIIRVRTLRTTAVLLEVVEKNTTNRTFLKTRKYTGANPLLYTWYLVYVNKDAAVRSFGRSRRRSHAAIFFDFFGGFLLFLFVF